MLRCDMAHEALAMPCHAMPCHAMPRYGVLCGMRCCAMLCYAVRCTHHQADEHRVVVMIGEVGRESAVIDEGLDRDRVALQRHIVIPHEHLAPWRPCSVGVRPLVRHACACDMGIRP